MSLLCGFFWQDSPVLEAAYAKVYLFFKNISEVFKRDVLKTIFVLNTFGILKLQLTSLLRSTE